MNWRNLLFGLLYIPSLILLIMAIYSNVPYWEYIGAVGWGIFITGISLAFKWIPKNNGKSKNKYIMKWTSKRTVSWLELHYADQFERIVPTNQGIPIKVMPKGAFRVGLIKGYDELVLVDLRPKQIRIDFSENDLISTQDSVKLGGTISIKASVKDNDGSILKLVSNEIDEDESLKSYLRVATKTIVSQFKWVDLTILNSDTLLQIKDVICTTLTHIDLCFKIDDVIDINFSPIDKDFAELLEKRQKDIESTKLKIEKLESEERAQKIIFEIEKEKIIRESENLELTQRKKLELENELIKIENERKVAAYAIENAQKKAIADLENEIFIQRSKILKDNPDSYAAIHPDGYLKIQLAKIEAEKEKEIRIHTTQENLTKLLLSAYAAKQDGRIEILKETLPESSNLSISTSTDTEIERLKQRIEELEKQNNKKNEKENENSD